MSKKIILTIMTFAILLAGVLGINTKASAAKKSTNRKSIDVIVGYKGYIRKVKVNGKITQLKYDKNYLKLTKNGNKIKFSEAFKAGKTTVTVKCKGCKTSKITVKIWKDELAWGYEFSRRWASNKKLAKKYLNNINLHPNYMKGARKFNKCKKLIIENYDAKEMAAAKKAAGKYVKVKFYKGNMDICCGNVVLLCNKKSDEGYRSRIYDAIRSCHVMHDMTMFNYYESLKRTLPGVKIICCDGGSRSDNNIYCCILFEGIAFEHTDTDETDINYDADDVKALKKIIEAQVASGAIISTDLSNSGNYTWDKQTGRLIGIDWTGKNLKGAISFSKLTALKELNCSFNQLTSLDVSGCTALQKMDCASNKLTSLDVSGCTALKELDCASNKLTSLDVSGCTALQKMDCASNKLTSLDVSGCTALKELNCSFNPLTSLDVSGCTALQKMDCTFNRLTSLDVSGNKALKELRLDEDVDLIGVSKDCNVTRESNETTTVEEDGTITTTTTTVEEDGTVTTTTTTTTVEEDGTITTTTTTTGIITK